MNPSAVLIWAHVVLFVYWLGADLGVLIAAIWVRNPARSFAERTVLLEIATAVDLTPRIAFALMIPVGLTLAGNWGLAIPNAGLAGAWAVAIGWIAAILAMGRSHGAPVGALLARLQFWFLIVAGLGYIGLGIYCLNDGGIVPSWLAWKILLFGCVFFAAILIDVCFRPLIPAFGRLAAEGSSADIERAIRRPIDRTIVVVLTLYLLLLTISFLGTVKPGA